MTDNEIKQALKCCLADKMMCEKCPIQDECESHPLEAVLAKYSLNLINRQEEMTNGLIVGQETLQKALAGKNAEIERLQNEVSTLEHKMSYMISPNTIGDRHEMGCW